MTAFTFPISNVTDFRHVDIDDNVRHLEVVWADSVNLQDKNRCIYEVKSFLFHLLQTKKAIKSLDLTHLDGLTEACFDIQHLYDIYLPLSVHTIRIHASASLRKVSALGARSIHLTQCTCLEFVEYGSHLEELCLSESGLTSITLPPHLRLVYGAFRGCKELKSVQISEDTELEPGTFEGCERLLEVQLPNDMLGIKANMFKDCRRLKFLCGGEHIRQISPSAFVGCEDLEYMDCLEWAQGMVEISIDSPETYISENYFNHRHKRVGVLVKYCTNIGRWIIWSLDSKRFHVSTKRYWPDYHIGDIVAFEEENKAQITIAQKIYIRRLPHYIDLSLCEMLQATDGEYSDLMEYFHPSIPPNLQIQGIINKVEQLDIPAIIDSYSIQVRTWWQSRPGRDDFEWLDRKAQSIYSDAYLNMLLPQEDSHNHSSGCRPWGYDEEMENRTAQIHADEEAERIKAKARGRYSKDEHIAILIQEIVKQRNELKDLVERKYCILSVMHFITNEHIDEMSIGHLQKLRFYNAVFK